MAFECNQIWNAANAETFDFAHTPIPEVGIMYIHRSAFDMSKQLATLRKERGFIIHSQTVQEVTEAHEKARKQEKRSEDSDSLSSASCVLDGAFRFGRGLSGPVRSAPVAALAESPLRVCI